MDRIEDKKKPNQTPILHILPLPFNGFCLLQRGFPTCFSLAFVPSFAEAGREARLKPALFLREYSLSPTG
jgi:hypothetical protein